MENLAVGVLRKAYEDFTPETPIDKMLCALVKGQDKYITEQNARIVSLEIELKSKTAALKLLHKVKQTQRDHIVLQRDIIQTIEKNALIATPSRPVTSRSNRSRKRDIQHSIPPVVSNPNQMHVLSRRTPFQRRTSLYQSTIIA